MMSRPYPNRHVKVIGSSLFLLLFVLLASILLAADVHHLQFQKPDQVFAGEEVNLIVRALNEDGTLNVTAVNELNLTLSVGDQANTYKLKMTDGVASLKHTFEIAESYLVWIQDINNTHLSKSGRIMVKPARSVDVEVQP